MWKPLRLATGYTSNTSFIDYTWSHTAASVHAMRMSGGLRDREPRTAMMADLNSANDSLHWIQQSTCEYGSCFFILRRSANLLKKVVHLHAIPPVIEKTCGVNTPLSTSLILSPYTHFCSFMDSVQLHKFLVSIRGGTRVKNIHQRRPPVLNSRNL